MLIGTALSGVISSFSTLFKNFHQWTFFSTESTKFAES